MYLQSVSSRVCPLCRMMSCADIPVAAALVMDPAQGQCPAYRFGSDVSASGRWPEAMAAACAASTALDDARDPLLGEGAIRYGRAA